MVAGASCQCYLALVTAYDVAPKLLQKLRYYLL